MATTRLSTVIGNVIVGATGPQGAQGATGPQGATPSIGGSNTHIQFNNSGSLDGTANLVWNGTGLGIGTTSPAAKLQIGVASAAVNGTKGVRITNPAGTIVMLECGSGGDSYVGTESGSDFNIRTNNTIHTTFLNGGNVGIGETLPTQKIHFKGSSTTYALAETTGTGTSSGFRMKAGASADYTLFTTQGTNQFAIYNNVTSTQPLTVDSSGNLGVGNTSPTAKVHSAINSTTLPSIIASNAGDYDQFQIRQPTRGGNFGWSCSGVGSENYVVIDRQRSDQVLEIHGTTNHIWNISNAEKMRLDSSGNLGVGTSSPSTGKFSDASYAFLIQSASTSTGTNIFASNSDNSKYIGLWSGHSGAEPAIGVKTGNALTFGKWAAINGTGGFTENMRIDSSGNVIIGGTLASTVGGSLHITKSSVGSVYTALYIQNTDNSPSGQGSQIVFRNSFTDGSTESTKSAYIRYSAASNYGEQGQLQFGTNTAYNTAPVTRLTITGAGNITIPYNGGILFAKSATAYGTIAELGFVSPIQAQETDTGTNSGRHIPIISGTSVSASGYRQHTVFGSYRGSAWGAATIYVGGNDNYPTRAFYFDYNGNFNADGTIYGATKSFKISHPLPELEATHNLVHTSVESPQADLIYRGVATLVDGIAIVNIDTAAGMTNGTFEAMCREVQCFTTNESDWTLVRGKVTGNLLTIEAQSNTATSEISWLVIGERKDKFMLNTDTTDENGRVIVEPLKQEHELEPVTPENTINEQ